MAVDLKPSWKRGRAKFNNFVPARAMSSDVMEDSNIFKRISIASNSSLKSKGSVAGKKLNTKETLLKT
jgi:hypothetical protein